MKPEQSQMRIELFQALGSVHFESGQALMTLYNFEIEASLWGLEYGFDEEELTQRLKKLMKEALSIRNLVTASFNKVKKKG